MNDSGEFQEVESNYSERLSYVSCQPAMIPSSRSMSRDKRVPLDTWNTSGLQENVFGNQFSTLDSPGDHHQGIHPCAPQRERGSVPQATGSGTRFARDDKQNRDICRKAVDYEFANTGGVSAEFYGWKAKKDSKYRNCNSTNSLIHNRFWCGKFDSKPKSPLVLIFHRMLCCGSEKWRWLILWTN